MCAGSLIHYRNNCKLPRDRALMAAVGEVQADPAVFNYTAEFEAHHGTIADAIAEELGFHSNPQFQQAVKGVLSVKTNAFNETVLEPGDDIYVAFVEAFDTDSDSALSAFDIEYDEDLKWSCLIEDENANSIQAHGFSTKEDLLAWLTSQGVAPVV
ncbi:hypothetical protein HOU03_gp434 [Caulobacter phage CcrSC]|uniref:Uncharacterized protein n=1 Tax=Caulobacter phage CcrSC TaxID=2283272 RepID=A0A385ED87_9CAUD|nr:hypothetical protein HOU03_gp434 [Caulobacter phage CcrSC]AXQ69834.1 hypothetical protein CcrSC_gp252c [Caulobacter phage CcrSC]